MLKTVIPVLFLVILSPILVLAQKLGPGYIVGLERDTTRGFIEDGTDTELVLEIKFRKDRSSAPSTYNPNNLIAFGFDYGRKFEAVAPDKNASSEKIPLRVFAKQIVSGKITMFVAENATSKLDIFLRNNASKRTVYLLSPSKEMIIDADGKQRISESLKHLGLLRVIKGDTVFQKSGRQENIKFSKKSVTKNIVQYNDQFKNDFPVAVYKQQRVFSHEATVGMPVTNTKDLTSFRVAFYRHRTLPEQSRKLSLIRGVTYSYWKDNAPIDPAIENTSLNYAQHMVSIIPFGFNYHGDSRTVRPYLYAGLGLAVLLNQDYQIDNHINNGSETQVVLFPTINIGAGVKIKIGSHYLLVEATPSLLQNGVFANMGYTF